MRSSVFASMVFALGATLVVAPAGSSVAETLVPFTAVLNGAQENPPQQPPQAPPPPG